MLVGVGRVGRPHGLDGSFVVEAASETEALFAPGRRLVAGGQEVEVVARKRSGGRLVVKLDRALPRGTPLEIAREQLPEPEEDSFYVVDVVGLEVLDDTGRPVGRVADVSPGVANDVLELDSGLAVPMHEECILDVDLAAGRIVVARAFTDAE